MDRLAEKLRDDAARIDADVSAELDGRIRASLRSIAREQPRAGRRPRAISLWWASSLTGLAAAIAVIAVINLAGNGAGPALGTAPPTPGVDAPRLPLKIETAVLTGPLDEELEALQSDLEKARNAVREDIPLAL